MTVAVAPAADRARADARHRRAGRTGQRSSVSSAALARLGDAFRAARRADSVTAPHPPDVPSYLAASDDMRAAELNAMLADPDVRAIVLARGGYGLMRILPRLDPEALRRDPKPIIGFSDATALLAWAYAAGVRGDARPDGRAARPRCPTPTSRS